MHPHLLRNDLKQGREGKRMSERTWVICIKQSERITAWMMLRWTWLLLLQCWLECWCSSWGIWRTYTCLQSPGIGFFKHAQSLFGSVLLFLSAWLHLHVVTCLLCLQAQQHIQAGQLHSDHHLFLKTERERETCFHAARPHSSFQAVREELRSLGSNSQLLILSAGPGSPAWVTMPEPWVWIPCRLRREETWTSKKGQRNTPIPRSSGRGDRLLIRELIKPWWEIWTVRPLRIGT